MKMIALLRCSPGEIELKTKELIKMLGGMDSYVKNGNKVVIKPNVLCAQDFYTGATTSPIMVGTLAKLCLQSGAKEVIIGESSNWGIDSMDAMLACGFGEAARESGALLQDFKKEPFIKKEIDGLVLKSVNIPKALYEADVVINCPVLKTHTMTKVTIGIKNLSVGISHDIDKQCNLHRVGIYPPISDEMEVHGSWLDSSIVDINSNVKTTLTIVDGVFGLHGPGAPLFGRQINSKLIFGGTDRVAVDTVGSKLLGHNARDVHHILNSYNKGMGEIDLEKIKVLGDKIEHFNFNIHQSFNTSLNGLPENLDVINGCRNCNACLSTITYVFSRHKADIEKMGVPIRVYVGKYFEDRKFKSERAMILYYGNCAGGHLYGGGFVPGCPPRSRRQVFQALGALDLYRPDEGLETDR